MIVFFFKQKTAYEMRISDWSSDVCSSDLLIDLQKNKPKEEPKTKAESQFSLGSIDIGGVTIDDGAIVYDDAQAGKHYELQKLHLETGSLNARDPFDLDLSTTVISKAPAAQVAVALSGTIKTDFKTQKPDTAELQPTPQAKQTKH